METNRGVPMVGYDIEVESHFHPGIWNILVTGKVYKLGLDMRKPVFGVCNQVISKQPAQLQRLVRKFKVRLWQVET